MLQFESLEHRRLFAVEHPVAINFGDEALWNENFQTAVAEAKALGVTSVRVWMSIYDYAARPTVSDVDPAWQDVAAVRGTNWTNPNGRVMRRVFELDQAGFSVMLVLQPSDGVVPPSNDALKGYVNHLKNSANANGTTIAQAVDYWELGNEPDIEHYWSESTAANKVNGEQQGLRSHVNKFMIPAAQALREGNTGEKIVSAGVSWNPNDLNTQLDELKKQNALGLIDYAGYHPYGRFMPEMGIDEQRVRALRAVTVAKGYGKDVVVTEWNVRGYNNNGSQDALWSAAIDQSFREVMAPNFVASYYYGLVDNWALRGGSVSGRPAGVLTHDSTATDVGSKTLPEIEAYLKTPLIKNEPFYSVFSGWQYGYVTGVVTGGSTLAGRTVWVDANGNQQRDAAEPFATTAANGTYSIQYRSSDFAPGTYNVRVAPVGNLAASPLATKLLATTTQANVNFALGTGPVVEPPPDPTPTPTPTPTTNKTVTVLTWNDADGNGLIERSEYAAPKRVVYLDLNGSGAYDAGDIGARTNRKGLATLTYDTANVTNGVFKLRQVVPDGWAISGRGYGNVQISPDVTYGEFLRLGSKVVVATPVGNGTIVGVLWNDLNGDGNVSRGEGRSGRGTVFLDANNNRRRDKGELAVTADRRSIFTFTDVPAGTYALSRVFAVGERLSNGVNGSIPLTVTAGVVTEANLGTTLLASSRRVGVFASGRAANEDESVAALVL